MVFSAVESWLYFGTINAEPSRRTPRNRTATSKRLPCKGKNYLQIFSPPAFHVLAAAELWKPTEVQAHWERRHSCRRRRLRRGAPFEARQRRSAGSANISNNRNARNHEWTRNGTNGRAAQDGRGCGHLPSVSGKSSALCFQYKNGGRLNH